MSTTSLVRRAAAGAAASTALIGAETQAASAQRADSARAAATAAAVRPPLSPRRAFLTSLIVPGYAQSILGRPNAAALFILTETIAVLMVLESAVELHEARRLQDDSVALSFLNPTTGQPGTTYQGARYPAALVRARRAHLEDWIAALVANHILAGADAFVAAHLWDVPARVGFRRGRDGDVTTLSVRYRW